MLKFDTEFWKPDQHKEFFSEKETYVRTIVMRFYNGSRALNDIWAEVYPLEDQEGATTLNEVSLIDLKSSDELLFDAVLIVQYGSQFVQDTHTIVICK